MQSPTANLLQRKTCYIGSTKATHSSQLRTKAIPTPTLLTVHKNPAHPCQAPYPDPLGKVPLLLHLIKTLMLTLECVFWFLA